jgi:polysaccharide export outer membrane protein
VLNQRIEPRAIVCRERLILLPVLLAFLAPLCWVVSAQTPARTESPEAIAKVRTDDSRYRIGAGDVLGVLVNKSPELSMDAVRVDQRGMIRLPMLQIDVVAVCKTESELANDIATLYLEYKKNPSVQVFVRDFQSRPVAVIGAVNAPGQFRLQRQIRLLELLSFAGGPSEKAGRIINVIHTGGSIICENDTIQKIPEGETQGLGIFKLTDTLIRPGDMISVPEADQVFVVGRVMAPRAIALRDKPITVSRAIAMAGGTQRDGDTGKVRIVRQLREGEDPREIRVDLKAIQSHKAEDIALLPNDIVEVGASTGKTILGILTGSVSGVLSSGIVRAVP